MKKFLLTLMLLMAFGLSAKGILDYPLSESENGELYLTSNITESYTLYSQGKHQNLDISPNYFNSYGIKTWGENTEEYIGSFMNWGGGAYLHLLEPSVSLSSSDILNNYSINGFFHFLYGFKIDTPIENLNLYLGPYAKATLFNGIYSGIDNIMVQTELGLNLGGKLGAEYSIFDTLRVGGDFSSFLVGGDIGRRGYNRDFLSTVTLSHFGNYLDMHLSLYGELDLSRTESIKLIYEHSAFSVFDSNNTLATGENSVGISYVKKLVR